MKKKFKKWFFFFGALAAVMMPAGVMPTYAYTDEVVQEVAHIEQSPIEEETSSDDEAEAAAPFSISGNGQLVDDISDDETKQFLTIQTKNGNTFFMVLDRTRSTDNVYMLSLIDENDLTGFLEETGQKPETENPPIDIPEPETVAETEAGSEETEMEPEESGMNVGALLALANMEFSDDSPYIADGQDGSDDDAQDEF